MAKKSSTGYYETDVDDDQPGTMTVAEAKDQTPEEKAKAKEKEDWEKAQQEVADYEPPPAPEPPPEAPAHEGVASYKVLQDVNIKHQDYPKGSAVALTHEEYQTLRAQGVHCEALNPPV